MFYKFSSLANRLMATNIIQAYHPQGLIPFSKVKIVPIQMTYKPVHFSQVEGIPRPTERLPLGPAMEREISTTPGMPQRMAPDGTPYGPMSPKIRALQQHFQKKDGLPIHLKGGQSDYAIYYGVMGASTLSVVYCLYIFYKMSFPKKPE